MRSKPAATPEVAEALRPLINWLGIAERPTVASLKSLMKYHPHIKTPVGLLDEADDSYVTADEVADIIWLTLNS